MKRIPEPEVMDQTESVDAYSRANFAEVNRLFVAKLVELTRRRDTATAIDLGCGPGFISILASEAKPRWKITAADASVEMLRVASREIAKAGVEFNVTTRLVDAKHIDQPDASVDVVFSNSLLHHLLDPEPMWREVKRIVRRGGLIFFRDLTRPESVDQAKSLVEQHAANEHPTLKREFYESLLAAFTEEEVRSQLTAAGIERGEVFRVTDRHFDVVVNV